MGDRLLPDSAGTVRDVTFHGTPLHPLVVHAAVVLIPVAALAGIAFAVRPTWRWWVRWPMVGLSVLAAGAVGSAYLTGRSLDHQRFATAQGALRDAINTHRHWAHLLLLATGVYVLVVLVAAWALGGPSALVSGRGARPNVAGWGVPMEVLLVLGALVVLVLVVRTGDAGARAVWNP
jgi:hypothetical protein